MTAGPGPSMLRNLKGWTAPTAPTKVVVPAELAAGLGDGHHLVAQPRQDLLEIVADVALVVGDGDPHGVAHV